MNLFSYSLNLILTFTLAACTYMGPNIIKTKVIALNPAEYEQQQIHIQGKLVNPILGMVLFDLQDDTGYITVSTENIPQKINCEPGSQVLLTGTPKQKQDSGKIIFILNSIIECKPEAKIKAAPK